MTQEDKILLAKDLFCRALSGVKVNYRGNVYILGYNMYLKDGNVAFESYPMMYFLEGVEEVKPYLRPMSNMTNEEKKYKLSKFFKVINTNIEGIGYIPTLNSVSAIEYVNWLIENHFDYNGLIPMGLALEAKEGMYNV